MSRVYSAVPVETGTKIMEWADSMGIDCTLWNPEDLMDDPLTTDIKMEIGMSQEAWDKWDSEKNKSTQHWDKRLAGVLREHGLSEEHICVVIGEVAENNQKIHMKAYQHGYETGYGEGYGQADTKWLRIVKKISDSEQKDGNKL